MDFDQVVFTRITKYIFPTACVGAAVTLAAQNEGGFAFLSGVLGIVIYLILRHFEVRLQQQRRMRKEKDQS